MSNTKQASSLNNGQGKKITVGDSLLFLKLSSADTDNKFTVTEYELAPKFIGPPPHWHKVFEHAWYIIEGNLTVQLNEEISVVSKGSFIFIPKKTVHAFSNKSNAIVKVLVVDSPGGIEAYYEDLQTAFSGKPIDQELMREIQLKYDTYPPEVAR
jgi:quercetin dioxygenase-like cupin family protein